nr:MAG TPA: portal protein [Caudoviricetes sp.]
MLTYYDLYNSIYDEKDLKYVTNPFKQKDGFPATAQDYNIIKPYVD